MRVCAIDVGSNSIRLLVAEVEGPNSPTLRTIARAGEPCRLGQGLDDSGHILPQMAERAAGLAATFATRARSLGVAHIVVGATAALRNAHNGSDVARMIGERAGVAVRILSGDEEACLVYHSVIAGLGPGVGRSACVVFDIGGGSTEVVSGVGGQPGRWASLPIGAVNLTERFIRSNPTESNELNDIKASIESHLMHECAFMPAKVPLLAGVGGTVTILALMDRDLTAYDPAAIEGWRIDSARLIALIERLASSSHEERRSWPAMGVGRADIVVAGAMVVRVLAERFPPGNVVCSTQGLRYGLARMAADELGRGHSPPV